MQTDKKEGRNTFFFPQIADDRSFIFAVRQNVPSSARGLPSCRTVALQSYTLLYIYTFQIPATANAGRGQTTAIVKSFRLFRK